MIRTTIGLVLATLMLTPAVSEATWPLFFKRRPVVVAPDYQMLLQDWYLRYLGRPLDYQGLDGWGRRLALGDNPREIEAAILGSGEYFQRNGGTNIGFIHGLFRDVMGTEPVGGQLEFWLNKLHDLEYRDDTAEQFLKAVRKARAVPVPPAVMQVPYPLPPGAQVQNPVQAFPPASFPSSNYPPPVVGQIPTIVGPNPTTIVPTPGTVSGPTIIPTPAIPTGDQRLVPVPSSPLPTLPTPLPFSPGR